MRLFNIESILHYHLNSISPQSIKHNIGNISSVNNLIENKHRQYSRLITYYSCLYYATRLCVGLGAGLLPFTLHYGSVPTVISAIIVVASVFDFVFNPKDKWKLFSKATDLLTVAQIKATGDYETYKDTLAVILETETAMLQQVIDIEELVKRVQQSQSQVSNAIIKPDAQNVSKQENTPS